MVCSHSVFITVKGSPQISPIPPFAYAAWRIQQLPKGAGIHWLPKRVALVDVALVCREHAPLGLRLHTFDQDAQVERVGHRNDAADDGDVSVAHLEIIDECPVHL